MAKLASHSFVTCIYSLVIIPNFFYSSLLREEDKNIFDYCRENNIEHVNKAIRSKKVDVNTKDEKVLGEGRD